MSRRRAKCGGVSVSEAQEATTRRRKHAPSSSRGAVRVGGRRNEGGVGRAAKAAPSAIDVAPEVPLIHRDAASPCPQQRGPGSFSYDAGVDATDVTYACHGDSECDGGANGRCDFEYWGFEGGAYGSYCSYDKCFLDTDCTEPSTCTCRASASSSTPNGCSFGDCRLDVDCVSGFCSPVAAGCGITWSFACHSGADECINDSDCVQNSNGNECQFDPYLKHFRCAGCPKDGGG